MKKKVFKFKINKMYSYWIYLRFIREYGILLFCQNLALDAKVDLWYQSLFSDLGFESKFMNFDKWMSIKLLGSNKSSIHNWNKVKKFNYLIGLKNVNDIIKIEKILKDYKLLIKGYYFQNIFFSKQDWDIKKIDKKNIFENLKKRLNIFYLLLVRIILLLKKRV